MPALDHLSHFVSRAMQRDFEWGVQDCILFPADWLAELTGIDPAADLRGSYDRAASAPVRGFLRDPMGTIAPTLAHLQPRASDDLRRGDVALILHGPDMAPHGAIWLGDGLAVVKPQTGVRVITPAKIMAAWALPVPGQPA
ncbi:MAG: DUF6950 family protein [Paracoccaceae bacterium]